MAAGLVGASVVFVWNPNWLQNVILVPAGSVTWFDGLGCAVSNLLLLHCSSIVRNRGQEERWSTDSCR